jgi:ankyrin repeat protein
MADADAEVDAPAASANVGSSSPPPAVAAIETTLRSRSYPVEEAGEKSSTEENEGNMDNDDNDCNVQGPSRAAAAVEGASSDLQRSALLVVELESVQKLLTQTLEMTRSLSVGVRSLAEAVEQRRPLEEVQAIAHSMMPPKVTWESEPRRPSESRLTGDRSSDLLPRDFHVPWATVQQLLAQTLEANRDICQGVRSVVDAYEQGRRPSLEPAPPPIQPITVRNTDETAAVDAVDAVDAGAGAVAVVHAEAETATSAPTDAETATSAHADAEAGSNHGSSSSGSSGGSGGKSSSESGSNLSRADAIVQGNLSLADAIVQGRPLEVIQAIVHARPHEVEECHPLHLGVRLQAAPDVIEYLADVVPEAHRRLQYTNGWPLLHHAARTSPLQVVRLVLRLDPGALTTQTVKGDDLPLHLVGANPDAVRVVRFLAHKRPAALREANRDGWLPLHAAAACMSVKAVEYLADRNKAVLGRTSGAGRLPLHVAAAERVRNGVDPTEVIRCLAGRRSSALHAQDSAGCLPLHLAARHATLPAVQALAELSERAMQEKTLRGALPLHYAALNNSATEQNSEALVVAFLVKLDPQALRAKDASGLLPIHYAASAHNHAAVRLLSKLYPDGLRQHTSEGFLPLQHAVCKGAPLELVQNLLLNYPEAALAPDRDGRTPGMLAEKYNAPTDVVTFLANDGPSRWLVQFLEDDGDPTQQLLVTKYFATLTLRDADAVATSGAIPHLVRLSSSPDDTIKDEAVRALFAGAAASTRFQKVFEEENGARNLAAMQERSNNDNADASSHGVAHEAQRPAEASSDATRSSPGGLGALALSHHGEKKTGGSHPSSGRVLLIRNDKVRSMFLSCIVVKPVCGVTLAPSRQVIVMGKPLLFSAVKRSRPFSFSTF